MFCRKCGTQIPDGEIRCPACETEIVLVTTEESAIVELPETPAAELKVEEPQEADKKAQATQKIKELLDRGKAFVAAHKDRKTVLVVVACIAVIVAGLVVMKFNCDAKGCNEFISEGSYCSAHKCWMAGCDNPRERSELYCSFHIAMEEFSAKAGLSISSVYVSSNSVSTIARGTVKNTSSTYTYKFVKLKGSFKNYSGQIIDTDWTYAVGSEGLAPGESATFDIYVDKNYSIDECDVTVMDYDYK